jgi:hypothetical protein
MTQRLSAKGTAGRRKIMQFAAARPDIVRSVSQRWLLKDWTRLRGLKPMPLWKDVPVEELTAQFDTLMFLDVVANGSGPRFLIRFLGHRIAQSYGADFCGRFLDEAIPPAWRHNAMQTYCKAVEIRLPVYNVVDTGDTEGKVVHMERLLLPFTTNGARADRLLASIETLSLEGRFEQRQLGHSPHASQSCALVAVIDPESLVVHGVQGR